MIETKDADLTAQESSQPILDHVVDGKKAWLRADIQRDDWFFKLPPECLDELRALLPELRRQKRRIDEIDAGGFALPACRAFMKRVQSALDDGVRFAVVDRLPMDELTDDEAYALYWILSWLPRAAGAAEADRHDDLQGP